MVNQRPPVVCSKPEFLLQIVPRSFDKNSPAQAVNVRTPVFWDESEGLEPVKSLTVAHVKLFRVSSNTKSASLSLVPLTGCNCFLLCSRALRISFGPWIATRYGMSVP